MISYRVICDEVEYRSSSIPTQEEARSLAEFLVNRTDCADYFDIVLVDSNCKDEEFVERLGRETPAEELERIEKLFHYQASYEEQWL